MEFSLMLRKVIEGLIQIYLLPFRIFTRMGLYAKGIIMSHEEHFHITADVIRREYRGNQGVIVDVGAYDGDSTIFFAKRFNNTIVGFEPNPAPFTKACKELEGYSNIDLYNQGLSNKVGLLDLYVSSNEVSSSLFPIKDFTELSFKNKISVSVTTLDIFFANYPEILLLKLDAQGAELNILEAGIETLKKTKLVLTEVSISEMYQDACLYYQVDKILRDNNFRIHTIMANYNNDGTKYFDTLYIKNRSKSV
jgi:FkbM family methyltransferase